MAAQVKLTVWSDYLCPWCYVAAVRLDDVESEFRDRVDLEWRSFLLRPEPLARDPEKFRRYTESWQRPASLEPRARLTVWQGEQPPPSHSVPAAVAAKAAATFGANSFGRYHRALLAAYFSEHRDVSDRAVLVAIAGATGIDPDAFDATLTRRGRDLEREVWQDYAAAVDRGITAVPTVLVDDEIAIPGAVDTDHYRRAIAARGV